MILVQISTSPTVMGGVWARLGLFGRGRYRNTILYQHSQRAIPKFRKRLLSESANRNRKVRISGFVPGFTTESFGKPTWVRFMKIWYGFARKRVYLM